MVIETKVTKILNDLTSSDESFDSSCDDASSVSYKSPQLVSETSSINAFNQRLVTYCTSRWFAKPICMSPIVCAQYGWICTDINTLECSSCGEKIVLKGDKTEFEYVSMIKSEGHNPICKWASNPLPPSVAFKIEDVKSLLGANLHKLTKLAETEKFDAANFWNVNNWVLPDLEELEEQREGLENSFINISEKLVPITRRILDITLFGWNIQSESLLSCNKCRRRVKSAAFKNREFDPIKQHFFWCPWICSYDDSEKEPGWKRNLKCNVKSPFKLNTSEIATEHGIETVKTVRTLFRTL